MEAAVIHGRLDWQRKAAPRARDLGTARILTAIEPVGQAMRAWSACKRWPSVDGWRATAD